MKKLEQAFRWYGPQDAVSLSEIKQIGASGIVTALHHIPPGDIWEIDQIGARKKMIEDEGLRWSVVESVNIHESIKTATETRDQMIEHYKQTLINLAKSGIDIVCYNFMPVLDWIRTDLHYNQTDGSTALRYDAVALCAFDLYILKRPAAEVEWSSEMQKKAEVYFTQLDQEAKEKLQNTILAGLPGTKEVYSIPLFKEHLDIYGDIDRNKLKENLFYFLEKVVPTAEEVGVKLAIHPDDPPFSVLGLPRIVSTEQDLKEIVEAVPSPSNGITFCTGSLGANPQNDLLGMVKGWENTSTFFT